MVAVICILFGLGVPLLCYFKKGCALANWRARRAHRAELAAKVARADAEYNKVLGPGAAAGENTWGDLQLQRTQKPPLYPTRGKAIQPMQQPLQPFQPALQASRAAAAAHADYDGSELSTEYEDESVASSVRFR